MKKKIIINCCEHCPLHDYYSRNNHFNSYYCTHPSVDGSEIENKSIIPDWCPLENN